MIDAAPIGGPPVGVVHSDATPSMDYTVRNAWVEALIDPKYKQGSGKLMQKVNGRLVFDALGILTHVAVTLGITAWEGVGADPTEWFTPGGEVGRISPRVYEWAGFKGMHPSQPVPLRWQGNLHPIYRLNDYYTLPFAQLAELIAEQY